MSLNDGNNTNNVSLGGTLGYLTDYMTYRGVENFYGNVWKMLDGIAWDGTWLGAPAAQPLYLTNNSNYFSDLDGKNQLHILDVAYIETASGYISDVENQIGFLPKTAVASSTTKLCDYYYQYSTVNRNYWRVVLVGGLATDGGAAGAFSLYASNAWSYVAVYFTGRLCF